MEPQHIALSGRPFSEFKAFLQKKIGEPIISFTAVKGGLVNQTFLLNTRTHRYVARVNDLDELPRFQKEQWCIAQATELGIKTSPVLDIGIFGEHSYALMAFVQGTRGDQLATNLHDVWRTLGEYAKKIHSIGSRGFGEDLDDIQRGNQESWQRFLHYNISSLSDTDLLIGKNIFDSNQSKILRGYFEELRRSELRFGLNHGDMSLLNTIVADNGIYLIDWGSAENSIVPHYDLGVILSDSLLEGSENFKAFLTGYGLDMVGFSAIKEEIKSLMLLIATDKIRWAADRKPSRLEATVQHFNKVYKWKTEDVSPLVQV